MPGNVFYNGYYAMRELIRTIERVGSTNNIKIIKALEGLKMPARERMQHSRCLDRTPTAITFSRPCTWGPGISSRKDNTDLFKIIGMAKPEDVVSETEKECKLETYEATPTYEL